MEAATPDTIAAQPAALSPQLTHLSCQLWYREEAEQFTKDLEERMHKYVQVGKLPPRALAIVLCDPSPTSGTSISGAVVRSS